MRYLGLLIILLLGFTSCDDAPKKIEPNNIIASITEGGYQNTDTTHHFEIDLKYPVVDANINPDLLIAINNTIPENFHHFVDREEFINAHLNLPENFNESNGEWKGLLQNTYTVRQLDSLLFINFSVYQYFVGAVHGNTYHHSIQLDLSTGKKLNYTDFIKTTPKSITQIKTIFNSNLPDSTCWGLKNDSATLKNIENLAFYKDSVIFYIDDYALCPFAFGLPDIRFSTDQLQDVLTTPSFSYFSEIEPVVEEGEIATH